MLKVARGRRCHMYAATMVYRRVRVRMHGGDVCGSPAAVNAPAGLRYGERRGGVEFCCTVVLSHLVERHLENKSWLRLSRRAQAHI